MVEEKRDFLAEARRIVTGESMMLPQREHINAMAHETELERMRLAACSAAALSNTPGTRANRLTGDHPYFSASYGDVCAAVDREITLREELVKLRASVDAATGERSYASALALAADHDTITPADMASIDKQIDEDMIAMGRELKTMARRLLGLRVNVPAAAATGGATRSVPIVHIPAVPIDQPTAPAGQAAGLEMVVTIDRHGFRTDPWWVTFRLAELPTPGGGPMPVMEGEQEFCAGQFPSEEAARAAVERIAGITIKEIIVRK